jgi:hypothetical protein
MGRLRHHISSTPSILASGLLSIFLAAAVGCGGDDDGDDTTDDDPDAGDDDGGVDASVADAAPLGSRSGLVAVTETVVTNPILLGGVPVINGAVVSVTYVDDDTVVPPLPDFPSNINNCAITIYDVKAGDEEPAPVDEGPFIVSGTANGEFGCAFDDGIGEYACQSTDPLLASGSAEGATVDDAGLLVLTGASFTEEMVGMRILLVGLEDKGDSADGVYPIVAFVDEEAIVITDFPFPAAAVDGATYTTFVGTGPMANFGTVDFLDDGVEDVVIEKGDSDLVPGFSMTAGARGEGFILSKDSNQPHEFPILKADDIIFACDDTAKECGAEPEQEAGQIDAIIVNGTTTDVLPPLKEDDGFTMLPAEAAFATFSCSMIGSDSITIPIDGVEAILGTNPLRVQMTVGRFVGQLPMSDTSSTTVVLGHSLTGFTTLEKL